eukprot:12510667-Alexandrium_andersonii.AAC.1
MLRQVLRKCLPCRRAAPGPLGATMSAPMEAAPDLPLGCCRRPAGARPQAAREALCAGRRSAGAPGR